MPRVRQQIETALPVEQAFDFIADFANAMVWDPGTVASQRLDDRPVGQGARFRLQVRIGPRIAPMDYRISEYDRPRRVVLEGSGSGVEARDEITFSSLPNGGTSVDYEAEIRLLGPLRLLQPFAGPAFAKIGRDAAEGMNRALADLANERKAVQ